MIIKTFKGAKLVPDNCSCTGYSEPACASAALDDAVDGGGGGSGGGGGDPTTASSSSAGQHKRDWNCDTAYVRMSTELYLHAF